MLVFKGFLTKKKLFMFGVVGVIITSVVLVSTQLQTFKPKPLPNININGVISTDFVITDSSLGGVSAAITLSKKHQKFVMIASSNRIGGQLTEQGVSTLDYWGRTYQNNSVLNGILNNMRDSGNIDKGQQYDGQFSGNATDGPGDTPINLENYLKSQIDPDYGQILYDTKITEVQKQGSNISSLVVQSSKNQNTTLKAKFFFDSSDMADVTRLAGMPLRFGLDSQEDTHEKIAMTAQERDDFVASFGDRIQPMTSPFALFDKGYSGNRNTVQEIIENQKELQQSKCLEQVCLDITKTDLKLLFPKQDYTRIILTFIQEPNQKLSTILPQASFVVENQSLKPKIYPTADNIHYQIELQTPFKDSLKLSIKSETKLQLLETIADFVPIKPTPPTDYNATEFNDYITKKNSGGKLIQKDAKSSLMRARRIVDSANLTKNSSVPNDIAKLANYNSQGISQINTDQNDFLIKQLDPKKYQNDTNYRKSFEVLAKSWSQKYAYWLLYDSGSNLLDCSSSEVFCNTARFQISPKVMNTNDGFAEIPYTREGVRPRGVQTLIYDDIVLNQNLCQNQDHDCTPLQLSNNETMPNKNLRGTSSYNINSNWLNSFDKFSIYGFMYFVDLHSLTDKVDEKDKVQAFYNQIEQKRGTKENLPLYLSQQQSRLTKPGTVSLGNLYNDQINNLMFCGKSISVSQLANSVTRLHPAESATGQACGILGKYLLDNNLEGLKAIDEKQIPNVQLSLIQGGMWILPLEDKELNLIPPEILNSYYQALIKKQLSPTISQYTDLNLKFLFEPNKTFEGQNTFDLQDSKIVSELKDYATKTNTKKVDDKLTRGQYAWLLYQQ